MRRVYVTLWLLWRAICSISFPSTPPNRSVLRSLPSRDRSQMCTEYFLHFLFSVIGAPCSESNPDGWVMNTVLEPKRNGLIQGRAPGTFFEDPTLSVERVRRTVCVSCMSAGTVHWSRSEIHKLPRHLRLNGIWKFVFNVLDRVLELQYCIRSAYLRTRPCALFGYMVCASPSTGTCAASPPPRALCVTVLPCPVASLSSPSPPIFPPSHPLPTPAECHN